MDNDNFVLKPCYSTCKNCIEYGNIINNKCTECYENYTLNGTNCYKICKYFYYFDSSNLYHCTYNNSCPSEYNKLIKDKNQCIDKCQNDDKYKYEYQNICLENEIAISTSIIIERNNENTEYILTNYSDYDNKNNIDNNFFTDNSNNDNLDNNFNKITDNIINDNIDNNFNYITDNIISDNTDNNSKSKNFIQFSDKKGLFP